MSAAGTNTGNGCATSVTGVSTITGANGLVLNYPWSLPPSLVIRPGESFRDNFGPLTRNQADALRTGATSTTRADFTSSACPSRKRLGFRGRRRSGLALLIEPPSCSVEIAEDPALQR